MSAQPVYVVPGFQFESVPDLSKVETRERLSQPAIEGFFAIVDKWHLKMDQAASLLGGIPRSTLYKMKTVASTLNQDQLMRISYMVGIYKALNILLPQGAANDWMTKLNHDYLFGGDRPLDYVLREGLPGLEKVRRLLDAARGGQ